MQNHFKKKGGGGEQQQSDVITEFKITMKQERFLKNHAQYIEIGLVLCSKYTHEQDTLYDN